MEFENLLKTITIQPQKWKKEELRYLRNVVLSVAAHPVNFPIVMGDEEISVHSQSDEGDNQDNNDGDNAGSAIITSTLGCIAAVAAGEDTSELASNPILSVLSRETGFRTVLQQDNDPLKEHQKVKLTHLTLVDGDKNQIHCRLATHLADTGRALSEGDMIKLDLFTELSYRVNQASPLMPAIFLIKYTRVRREPVPRDIKDMIPYTYNPPQLNLHDDQRKSPYPIIDPITQPTPKCTYDNRLCRKFGINFIGRCICEEILVADRDLDIIAEDCHLINKPAKELTENKPKRLMLYWWYARKYLLDQ